MTGIRKSQKHQKRMSEKISDKSSPNCQGRRNSNCKLQRFPMESATVLNRTRKRRGRPTTVTSTGEFDTARTAAEMALGPRLLGKSCNRNNVYSFLRSCNAMHLLDGIPEAKHVLFVNQSSLSHAQPKKLLVGHHVQSGDHIYAYMVSLNTPNGLKFHAEDINGHCKSIISRDQLATHHILHPFNKTYLLGPQAMTQTDQARLELVVKWYFVAAGIVTTCLRREGRTFSKHLCSALRYIASMSDHTGVWLPHRYIAQQPHGRCISESDIQLSLLQQTSAYT
jgi:hypothetical protein